MTNETIQGWCSFLGGHGGFANRSHNETRAQTPSNSLGVGVSGDRRQIQFPSTSPSIRNLVKDVFRLGWNRSSIRSPFPARNVRRVGRPRWPPFCWFRSWPKGRNNGCHPPEVEGTFLRIGRLSHCTEEGGLRTGGIRSADLHSI